MESGMKAMFIAATGFFLSAFVAVAQWEPVWSDEFDYTGLPDSTRWGYDVGTGSNGWGNNELQYYTEDSLKNGRVENGHLIITARRERMGSCDYTSARLVTKKKGDWLYGRFEIAAKLPQGRGLWPAIWMLPTDREYGGWPLSGELDIMENVGYDPNTVHFNIHTEAYNHKGGTNKGDTLIIDDPHSVFVVYALEWSEDSVVFFADGRRAFAFINEHTGPATWPFDRRFHLLLNIAVGGSWGGAQGIDTNVFPQEMVVDYVRVYRKTTSRTAHGGNPVCGKPCREVVCFRGRDLVVNVSGGGSLSLFSVDGKPLFSTDIYPDAKQSHYPCSLPAGLYAASLKTTGKQSGFYRLVKAR